MSGSGPGWEKLLRFRCTGCGNCCKGTHICVTDADVRRLSEGLKRSAESFIHFVPEDDIALGKRHGWWVRFARRKLRGVMALKWNKGRCIFLDEQERCTAYAFRPIVCRIHPFNVTLTDEDKGGVAKLTMSRVTPCPHEWDGHVKKRDLSLLERLLWRESDAYMTKVVAWNRRRKGVRTPRQYLRELFEGASPE